MPGAAGQVFIDMEIGMIQNVQAGAFLVADYDGEGILEFLAEANVEHAGIERASPHADIEPARAGEGAGDGARQYEAGGCGEHKCILVRILMAFTGV